MLSFAGELKYPDHLTEDFDTSSQIGFGIKLPQYNRLGFRLDLIPVPGPIPVVPTFEFNIDLRTPGLPGIANTQVCEPVWDGFQLHVPGMIRADVKVLAASPILGVIPAVNVRFGGDLDLGDERFGLTFVCDDLLWLAGIGTPPNAVPVQFLIDPFAPYFEHLCVNVRCAGFGINFDVERPVPLPNPLLVFDVLALIADPLKPLDPKSPLARLMRFAVQDAYISIPLWARPLIPGGAQVVRNELNFEIDAGTLISAVQWVARSLPPVIQSAQDALAAGRQALEDLKSHPVRIDGGELLALLPPQLRIVECELSFAGFAASASLVLITPEDAQSRTRAVNQLWQLPALAGFTRGDLTRLPGLPEQVAAALAVAEIELLNVASYRFFGRLADDGSFVLINSGQNRSPPYFDQRNQDRSPAEVSRSPDTYRSGRGTAPLCRGTRPGQRTVGYRARRTAGFRRREAAARAALEFHRPVHPGGGQQGGLLRRDAASHWNSGGKRVPPRRYGRDGFRLGRYAPPAGLVASRLGLCGYRART